MADFCSTCAPRYDFEITYDLAEIIKSLQPGYAQSLLCEGCGLRALARFDDGSLKARYQRSPDKWVVYVPDADLV